MEYLRAFIAGTVFPTCLIPILNFLTSQVGRSGFSQITLVHWLPIIWGVWNVLYLYAANNKMLPKDANISWLGAGALLGLILAVVGIFWIDLPSIMGFGNYRYWPLIGVPILYALVWRFIVKPLTEIVVR